MASAGPSKSAWTLSTRTQGGEQVRFTIDDAGALMNLSSNTTAWTADADRTSALPPDGSGGLLPALYLWRRLAVEGLGRFGDVSYFGTAPLAGHESLCDVLVGSYKEFHCRFYFDPDEGRLVAIEMFPDEQADPCELYFSQFHRVDDHSVPGQMEVRFGDKVFTMLTLSAETATD